MEFEIALNRMCRGSLSEDDEGFATFIENPPSIEEIQTKFRSLRKSYEMSLAELRAKQLGKPSGHNDPGMGSAPPGY